LGSFDPAEIRRHLRSVERDESISDESISDEPSPQEASPLHAFADALSSLASSDRACSEDAEQGPYDDESPGIEEPGRAREAALDAPIFEVDDTMPSFGDVWDDEAWNEVDREADRVLRAIQAAQSQPNRPHFDLAQLDPALDNSPQLRRRVDQAQQLDGPHPIQSEQEAEAAKFSAGLFASRVALLFGGLTLTAGAVVLAWGHIEAFAAWRVAGIVAGAIGQLVVITGLFGILMTLWQSNRATRKSLRELDYQIRIIQLSSHVNTNSKGGGGDDDAAARSFYTHYVNGANSRTLIADLRGQIDLLAKIINDDERAA